MKYNTLHKLMLVDDLPENIFALENILEAKDREFIIAGSGEEALKLLLKHDVDLILLDVQMPGMDGFETAQLIRGTQKTRHIPIIFVTAISKEEKHIFKGYESGAIDYMFKPLEPLIVKNKVNILLELSDQRKMLEAQNKELLIAKRNAESIFRNVEEGICIVDPSLNIQPQYSAALEEILSEKELANKNIMDVFHRHLDENNYTDTKDFLELMLNDDIGELDLDELNPLYNVSYKENLKLNDKRYIKYLNFNLKRISGENAIVGLLITVTDQTAQILMEKQLKLAEEKSKRNYEVINILKVEPLLVKEFLNQADREIRKINDEVKDMNKSNFSIDQIDFVYRLIHSTKGNASLLGLDFISQKAHEFEQIISDTNHDADSFISKKPELFVLINQINETLHEIHGLISIMKDFYENYNQESGNKGELLINAIYGLINKTKDENHREIKFNYRDFNSRILPVHSFLDIKDVLIQLTRNTLAHNFKNGNGKKQPLNINLTAGKNANNIIITFEDDGIGLQYDKIKQKALEQKKYTSEQLESMSQAELAELIFSSGFSTSNEADFDSGRGMGMCIIKQKIQDLNGSIEVDSKEGQFCSFKIFLPIVDEN